MDSRPSDSPVKHNTVQASVSSSSSVGDEQLTILVEVSNVTTDKKDSKLVQQVRDMALEGSIRAEGSNHLTTSLKNKSGMFEEEEEGELDYEEDEGEIPGAHEDRNGVKTDTDGDREEGELEDGDEEEGEEGEILSDEDDKGPASEKKSQEHQDSTVTETDGPEEGEVIEEGDSPGGQSLRRKTCRYFIHGGCTWGMSCRFLHPGINDKGAYQMLPIPGQYPSPFPKAPIIAPPVLPEAMVQAHGMPSLPDQDDGQVDEDLSVDRMLQLNPSEVAGASVAPPPKKETAWERGLKLAKEIKKAAQKRKEEDADFQEKRMVLGITADENEDENDKENLIRRREMMRARLEKDTMFDEGDVRHRRGGDIVARWRDKKQPSPDRERDRRKRRGNRSPSSSPDRRNKKRGGDKEKQKGKSGKEAVRERDKQRTKTMTKEVEKKQEEKVKKQKEKDSDSGKEKLVTDDKKNEPQVIQEKATNVKAQASSVVKNEEQKVDDEKRKKVPQEKTTVDSELKSGREAGKRDELNEADERDKPRTKALGISSSRLPNDEWMDPWQRTTSPKRHSVSSRSSRSRSSSSSSDSSRSSQTRSHSGSESRSTSRSTSRSQSRSVSESPSRSSSRSRSGSRSNSHSRSGSVASASDHSSSSGSKAAANEGDEKDTKQVSHDSSESESESDKSGSNSKSPTPQKSPAKPKMSPDRGQRTLQEESSVYRNAKDRKNRSEYSREEKILKWQEGQVRQGSPWDRRMERLRPMETGPYRDRAYNSRRKRSPELRRRSRSPPPRNEERRRVDEGRTRERSSSADSMEHALARPSSPRATRERGALRRGSSVSSSESDSGSSDTRSESEEEGHSVRTRRAGPVIDQIKQAPIVPLSSGNIRYTGHKDIKLTLNKSVARTDNKEAPRSQSQHSLPARTEASGVKLQTVAKKRPRDPSPVSDHTKETVSSPVPTQPTNKPDKRSTNSQGQPMTSGKTNAANTSSRREELLRELKAVEDAIARKRARIE